MAPMRSHIFDQFKRLRTTRKVSFWYGGRSFKELFYLEDFDSIQTEFDNFVWHVALSDQRVVQEEDDWENPDAPSRPLGCKGGYLGFITMCFVMNISMTIQHPKIVNTIFVDHPS